MGTIANAKVTHYYNCYNGDFIGCLHKSSWHKCTCIDKSEGDSVHSSENQCHVEGD